MYYQGLVFKTGRARFIIPAKKQGFKFKPHPYQERDNDKHQHFASSASNRSVVPTPNPRSSASVHAEQKEEQKELPHLFFQIYDGTVRYEDARAWLSTLFDIKNIKFYPMGNGIRGNIWLKDPSQARAIYKRCKGKLNYKGSNAAIFDKPKPYKEEHAVISAPEEVKADYIGQPKSEIKKEPQPDLLIGMSAAQPSDLELPEWLHQFCDYEKYEMVSREVEGKLKTTLKIWLSNPADAPVLVAKYGAKGSLNFKGLSVKPFLPGDKSEKHQHYQEGNGGSRGRGEFRGGPRGRGHFGRGRGRGRRGDQ